MGNLNHDAVMDMVAASLLEMKVKRLREFCQEEMIKVPRYMRNKVGYATLIADHFNRTKYEISLGRGTLHIGILAWRS